MELSLPATAADPAGAPAFRDTDPYGTAPGTLPSGDAAPRDPLGPGRRTLALRLAQRGRLRELRAERLARLRPDSAALPPSRATAVPQPAVPQPAAAQPAMPQADPVAAPAPTPGTPSGPAVAAIRTPVPLTPRKAAEEDAVAALEEFLRALTGGLGEAAPADWGLPAPAAPGPAAVLPFQRRDPEAAPENLPETAAAADPAPAPEALPAEMTGTAAAQEAVPETEIGTTVATAVEAVPGIAPETAPAVAMPQDSALAETEAVPAPAAAPALADPLPAAGLAQLPGAGPGLLWALDRAGITDIADLAGLAPEALAERLGPIGRLIPAARWIEAARTPGLSAG